MSDKPLVSVVTCFLNAGRFIQETIESVLSQTHDAWELLLVDDGSKDASTEIARRYALRYPDKVSCRDHPGHENQGSSASRNLALRHARGEYVAILDADDVWLPHALERRVQVLQSRTEVGMLYGPALRWHGWTGDAHDRQRDWMENLQLASGAFFEPPGYCGYLLDYDAAIPSPCAILLRRKVVESVGGFEDSFRDLFDDQVFYIKLAAHSGVLVSDECDSKYRQHPESTCAVANRTGKTTAARLAYLEWVGRYLKEQAVQDPKVLRAWKLMHVRFNHPWRHRFGEWSRRLVGELRPARDHGACANA